MPEEPVQEWFVNPTHALDVLRTTKATLRDFYKKPKPERDSKHQRRLERALRRSKIYLTAFGGDLVHGCPTCGLKHFPKEI